MPMLLGFFTYAHPLFRGSACSEKRVSGQSDIEYLYGNKSKLLTLTSFNLPKHNEIDTKNLYVGSATSDKSVPL